MCEYFVIAGVTVLYRMRHKTRIYVELHLCKNAIELYRQMRNRLRKILSAVLQQG